MKKKKRISPELAAALRQGLGDNWSQVRFAANVATRKFMTSSKSFGTSNFYDELIPGL